MTVRGQIHYLSSSQKWRKEVCVTLREWAAFILKCEYEPPTLDATSKVILKQSHEKKKNTRC
jgi:hypothetical protein